MPALPSCCAHLRISMNVAICCNAISSCSVVSWYSSSQLKQAQNKTALKSKEKRLQCGLGAARGQRIALSKLFFDGLLAAQLRQWILFIAFRSDSLRSVQLFWVRLSIQVLLSVFERGHCGPVVRYKLLTLSLLQTPQKSLSMHKEKIVRPTFSCPFMATDNFILFRRQSRYCLLCSACISSSLANFFLTPGTQDWLSDCRLWFVAVVAFLHSLLRRSTLVRQCSSALQPSCGSWNRGTPEPPRRQKFLRAYLCHATVNEKCQA